jgi:iron complex outermembrane receptor protein
MQFKKTALYSSMLAVLIPNAAFSAEDTQQVEKIEVTGSRILRQEFESASPIASFDESDLIASGVGSVDEFLKNIPSFTGFQMGGSTNNGSDQGQKKIDLRGLGFERTLVLINGRRQIGDVNGDGAVDLNAVPMALVKRIEVLKDGASTIYGTDAIAGVVNIILKDDFEGAEVSISYGAGTEEWDAENKGIAFTFGVAGDKGNIVASLEYSKQGEIKQLDRDFAARGIFPILNDDKSAFILGPSGSSNSRRIRGIDGLPGNYIVDEGTGEVREFNAATDLYDYSPVNALMQPNEKWQFGLNAKINVSDTVEAFGEALYTKRTSQERLAPDASFGTTASYISKLTGEEQWNDLVPASNPYNPFGVNANNPFGVSNQAVRVNRRFVESGGRLFQQSTDTFRIVSGFKGEFSDSLFWDVSYTFAQNENIQNTRNYHRLDKWEIAVTPELCNADAACKAAGVLNPFAPYGTISQEQMDFLSVGSLKNLYFGQMQLWQFNLYGDINADILAGGPIGWAIGYETRKEKGSFTPDEFASEGLTTSGASDPQSGSFSVDEIYGELYLPVLDNLSISTSARYSDYDTSAGSDFNYKIGFDWNVLDGVKVRGGFATGFRAPNISELNQQDSTDFPVAESLCEFASAMPGQSQVRNDISQTVRDNCAAMGVSPAELGFAWQSAYTTKAPTVDLKPEESESITFGVVYQSQALEGLIVSVDYWNISIDQWIDDIPYNDLFSQCMNSVGLSSPACNAFPNGVPYDGDFPADAESAFGNLGKVETDGIDFEVQYGLEALEGKFDFLFSGTYVMSREENWPSLGFQRDVVGTADGFAVFPEWRTNTTLRYSRDDWSVAWDTTYIGETTDKNRPANITADNIADAVLYHDLSANYNFEFAAVSVGINNLLDKEPPYFHSAFNANTEPGVYDVIGRRLFVNLKFNF